MSDGGSQRKKSKGGCNKGEGALLLTSSYFPLSSSSSSKARACMDEKEDIERNEAPLLLLLLPPSFLALRVKDSPMEGYTKANLFLRRAAKKSVPTVKRRMVPGGFFPFLRSRRRLIPARPFIVGGGGARGGNEDGSFLAPIAPSRQAAAALCCRCKEWRRRCECAPSHIGIATAHARMDERREGSTLVGWVQRCIHPLLSSLFSVCLAALTPSRNRKIGEQKRAFSSLLSLE